VVLCIWIGKQTIHFRNSCCVVVLIRILRAHFHFGSRQNNPNTKVALEYEHKIDARLGHSWEDYSSYKTPHLLSNLSHLIARAHQPVSHAQLKGVKQHRKVVIFEFGYVDTFGKRHGRNEIESPPIHPHADGLDLHWGQSFSNTAGDL